MEHGNKITVEERHVDLSVLDYDTLDIMGDLLRRDCTTLNTILGECANGTEAVHKMLIDFQEELLHEWKQIINEKEFRCNDMLEKLGYKGGFNEEE